MSDYSLRILALQEQLRSERAGMAILAGTDQMRYLTGWKEGGHERFVGLFVPSRGNPTLVVPAMNAPQARAAVPASHGVIGWLDETGWLGAASGVLGDLAAGPESIFVDYELLSVHILNLQAHHTSVKFRAIGQTMSRLREIKPDGELADLKRAADLIVSIIEVAYTVLREGHVRTRTAGLVSICLPEV